MAWNKRKTLEAARKYAQKGAQEKALKEYRKLLRADPNDAKLRLEIGDAYRRWGQVGEAIETYTKVAEQYAREGFDARAVAVYKQIQNLDPERLAVHEPLADLYQRLGLSGEAVHALQTAAEGFRRAGQKAETIGVLRKLAARAWERILEIEPKNRDVLASAARSHLRLGNADHGARAEEFARRIAEIEPEEPESYELLAEAYRNQDRRDEMIGAYRSLAEVFKQRGDVERSREIMQRYVSTGSFGDGEAEGDDLFGAPVSFDVGAHPDEPAPGPGEGLHLGEDTLLDPPLVDVPEPPPAGDPGPADDLPLDSGSDVTSLLEDDFLADEPLLDLDDVGDLGEMGDLADGEFGEAGVATDLAGELAGSDPDEETQHRVPGPAVVAAEPSEALSGDPDQLLAEASVYLRYGKRSQAQANLEALLEREPRRRQALEMLGELRAEDAEPRAALELWLRAAEVARDEGDPDAHAALRERIAGLDPHAAARLEPLPEPVVPGPPPEDPDGLDLGEIEVELDPEEATSLAEAQAEARAEESVANTSASHSLSQQILEDLEEADFYLQQGLLDEAESVYARLLKIAPSHPRVLVRLGEIAAARGGEAPAAPLPSTEASAPVAPEIEAEIEIEPDPDDEAILDDTDPDDAVLDAAVFAEPIPSEPPPPAARPAEAPPDPIPAVTPAVATAGDFDLAAELAQAFDSSASGAAPGASAPGVDDEGFAAVFEEFKQGVKESLSEADHEAHYDLGIAYREMGLLGDAAQEFRLAAQSSERRVDSLHMLGLCYLDLGRSQDAIDRLGEALSDSRSTREQGLAIRFELGRAYEGVGDLQNARETYELVAGVDPLFCNVEERLARLDELSKSGFDANPAADAPEFESFEDVIAEVGDDTDAGDAQTTSQVEPRRRRRISFL